MSLPRYSVLACSDFISMQALAVILFFFLMIPLWQLHIHSHKLQVDQIGRRNVLEQLLKPVCSQDNSRVLLGLPPEVSPGWMALALSVSPHSPLRTFTALLWTLSSMSMSLLYWGTQFWMQFRAHQCWIEEVCVPNDNYLQRLIINHWRCVLLVNVNVVVFWNMKLAWSISLSNMLITLISNCLICACKYIVCVCVCVYSVVRRERGKKKNSRLCCSCLESQVRDLEIWPMASSIAQLDRQAEGCTALSANPSQQQGNQKSL